MGPHSEGGPSSDGLNLGAPYGDDGRRYQSDLDLPRPNGAFSSEHRMATAVGSAGGHDREIETNKRDGERNRSRNRSARTASGQIRVCKKCGEALTGQFVRALGGTFHLDCFRCRVRRFQSLLSTYSY